MTRLDTSAKPRVAILGIILESNAFAAVSTSADFRRLCYLEGDAITREAGRENSIAPMELKGFYAAMAATPWEPVPIILTAADPGGPVEHDFFAATLQDIRRQLCEALPLDAVYIISHGGMVSPVEQDPDGALYQMVRETVGAGVPVVATVDLHANISDRMAESVDALISYRTNPHVDQRERGAEAAAMLREMFGGLRPVKAFIRLPLVPPTITLLTATGPYAELVARGEGAMGGEIMNVSVVGGDPFTDTIKNGLAIIVSARSDVAAARALAASLARQAWDGRERFVRALTPLPVAVARAVAAGRDPALPSLILADVADNPGGGGTGNTTELLEALLEADASGVLLGLFYDAALADEAHRRGVGARFAAVFNRNGNSEFSPRFEAIVDVVSLADGKCVGQRGLWVGRALDVGPAAALRVGGIVVVVTSVRKQCADPVFFSMLELDPAQARIVVVKSRGHFRAGFDHLFSPERILEVDGPGLTTPVLERLPWKNLPRPVFPIDRDTSWTSPAWA